jgi:surface protein
MPFPTTPVLPRRTDGLQEFEDVLQDTSTPHRPVQRLPEKLCLSPTRGVLPAGHHAPTLTTRPGAGGQRPTIAADVGQGSSVGVGIPSPGVSGDVVCPWERVQARVASPPPPSFYCACPPEEVGPLCPAPARPPRTRGEEREVEHVVERHKQRGRGGGGNKDYGRKSGGGFGSSFKQRGGGRWVQNLLVGLLLVVVYGLGGVEGFAKLPNGDGPNTAGGYAPPATGTAGTLRRAVSDWIAAGGASSSVVVTTYGPIEDWDVSEVTNMAYLFYSDGNSASTFGKFNADLSKWNTGAVTTMYKSKCTLSLSRSLTLSVLCGHGAFRCSVLLDVYDNSRFVGSQVSHVLFFLCGCGLNRDLVVVGCVVGFGLSFLCCTLLSSCSVWFRICVQSECVKLEHGGGDKYGT